MPRMISLIPHRYNAVELKAGDAFDADPRFVPVLLGLNRAVLDEPKPAEAIQPAAIEPAAAEGGSDYGTRALEAENAHMTTPAAADPAAPTPYRRTDMAANTTRRDRGRRGQQ